MNLLYVVQVNGDDDDDNGDDDDDSNDDGDDDDNEGDFVLSELNPSNAEATFIQGTMMQRFSKTI